MAFRYIEVPVTTDATTMVNSAIAAIQARWPDWEANPADLETVLLEAVASMASDAAEVASVVPAAVFRAYGTDLAMVPYQDGAAATGELTITLTDTDGHTIPAGTEFDVDGFAFQTDEDAVVTVGNSTAVVPITANLVGIEGNELAGDVVNLISAVAFIDHAVLNAPTTDGVDQEDDFDYMDRLSTALQLQAITLVTERDFVLMALQDPRIARAVAVNDGDRAVEVTLVGPDGLAVSTDCKNDLAAIYEAYRQVNTVVTISDATYTAVTVTYAIKPYDGYDGATLVAAVDAMLEDLLSPANWGVPKTSTLGAQGEWENDTKVRKNLLIDRIGDVDGVHYVDSLAISGADGAGNLTLSGAVPLPSGVTPIGSFV